MANEVKTFSAFEQNESAEGKLNEKQEKRVRERDEG